MGAGSSTEILCGIHFPSFASSVGAVVKKSCVGAAVKKSRAGVVKNSCVESEMKKSCVGTVVKQSCVRAVAKKSSVGASLALASASALHLREVVFLDQGQFGTCRPMRPGGLW